MGWYSDIAKDISKIPDAVAYYEDELAQARKETFIKGNVERAAAEMPGLVAVSYTHLTLPTKA